MDAFYVFILQLHALFNVAHEMKVATEKCGKINLLSVMLLRLRLYTVHLHYLIDQAMSRFI